MSHRKLDLRSMQRMRATVVFVVAVLALGGVTSYIVQGVLVARGDRDAAEIARLVASGMTQVINLTIVFLAWAIFEALGRIEREADRIQSFMDNVYRRLP